MKNIVLPIILILGFISLVQAQNCTPPPPIPTIAYNPATPCGGYDVIITASPADADMTYTWTFDDGQMDTLEGDVVVHQFPPAETDADYNIQLTITDADGCTSMASAPITVINTPVFEVIGQFQACLPSFSDQTTFTTNLEIIGGEPGATYNWFFGDGGTLLASTDEMVSHTYTDYGTYDLVVQSSNGTCLGTFEQEITFNKRPTADMTILGTTDICEGDTIFTQNNTDPSEVDFYVWDWGNGFRDTVYNNDNAFFIYEYADDVACNNPPDGGFQYDITLIAVNNCFEHSNSSPVYVSLFPRAIIGQAADLCASDPTMTFGNISCPDPNSGYYDPSQYSWDFGDGTTGTGANPEHTFPGPGVYTVTMSATNVCGTNTDSIDITVIDDAVADGDVTLSANSVDSLCIPFDAYFQSLATGDNVQILWEISPSSGWIYINGTDSVSANPQIQVTEIGNYFVQLTASNSCDTTTWDTTLLAITLPEIELDPIGFFCDTVTIDPPVYSVVPGGSNNLTYTWEFPGGVPATATGEVPPNVFYGSPGTYDVIVTVENECGTDTDMVSFLIDPTPLADAGPDLDFCIDDDPYQLTATPAGGTFSGVGITSDGVFTPLFAGVGNHQVYYENINIDCPTYDTVNITVHDLPIVDAGPTQSLCINDGLLTLIGETPTGGTWSGTGVVDAVNGIFDPEIAGVGSFNIIYAYTDGNGCVNTDFKVVEVIGLPIINAGGTVTYCNIPDDIIITGYSPAGGTWAGTGIVDANQGVFNTALAGGIGSYEVSYTYTDINGCTSVDTLNIEVVDLPIVSAGEDFELCVDEPEFELTGFSPAGGTWAGPGIIEVSPGTFYADAAGVGTHEIIYTVGSGSCQVSDTVQVLIYGLPTIEAGPNETWCEDDNIYILGGFFPTGGVWSGSGIIDGVAGSFDPSQADIGTNTISYTYVDPVTGCQNVDTKLITIVPLPIVNAGPDVVFCNIPEDIPLTGYSPFGGTWSGPGIVDPISGVFNPGGAGGVGDYEVIYTYENAQGCVNRDTLEIEVITPTPVEAGPRDTVCLDAPSFVQTGFSPAGGTWSGPGIINSAEGLFDPAQAGSGLHELTYTFGSGSCLDSDIKEIYVAPLPPINPGSDIEVCADDTIFALTGFSPTAGIWTGTGITDPAGFFDPQVSGIGTFTISLSYTDPVTMCENSESIDVTVHPLPIVEAGDPVSYCNTNDNIVLEDYFPTGGVWTGPGVVDGFNGIFNAGAAGGTGQYDLVYTYTDINGCADFDSLLVTIIDADILVLGPNDTLCIDSGIFTLSGYTPPGGTWSGPGITDANAGIFDPAGAGVGIHTITYSIGTGTCLQRADKTVWVADLPFVYAGEDEEACVNDPVYLLENFTPDGGEWSGTGVDSAGLFDAQTAGVGTHMLTYTYENPITGCVNSDIKAVLVNPLPFVSAGDTAVYCDNPNDIQLTGFSPLGGQWTGPGIIDPVDGIFNSGNAGGVGTYEAEYTYTDNNGCTNEDTLIIDILYGDTVLAGPDTAFCIDYGLYTLYGSPEGGVWTGPGVVDPSGIFDPLEAGAGVHILTYTFGEETCEKTDTREILIGTVPIVSAGPDEVGCSADAAYNLENFSPPGGVWTGTGIIDPAGVFDPVVAGPGRDTLTYTYTNPLTGCEDSDTKVIELDAAPIVEAGPDLTICNSSTDITFADYSPLGGVWTGPGVIDAINGVFNSNIAGGPGDYVITYGFTSENGCYNEDTLTVFVLPPPVVDAGPDTAMCIDNGLYTLVDFSPAGGTWTGTGIVNSAGAFDPAVAGLGQHVLTYTYGEGTCEVTSDVTILVGTPPIVNAGDDQTVCVNTPQFTLTGFSPQGGYWTGPGIVDSFDFDPSLLGVGLHTITYNYINSITGCEASDTRNIAISNIPTLSVVDSLTYCNTFNDITITGYSPQGGIWTGPGIVDEDNGIFNTTIAGGVGEYVVYYEYTNGSGCTAMDSLNIQVVEGDPVEAGPNFAICIDAGSTILMGFSPAGGTWTGPGIIDAVGAEFDPAVAGEGLHTLTYTYGDESCEKSDELEVFVGTEPSVVAGPDEDVCISIPPFQLSGFNPPGGVWTGTGITDPSGTFDPGSAGLGTHTLTYTYTNPLTGCVGFADKEIEVVPVPAVYAGDTLEFCSNPANIELFASPQGGIWSGPGILDPNGIFNTGAAGGVGQYELIYVYEQNNGCDGMDTLIVDVVPPPAIDAGTPDTICINDGLLTFTGFSPAGGTWSGPGIVDPFMGVFDPLTAGEGLHTVTYIYGEETCEVADSKTVFVGGLPDINLGDDIVVCDGDVAFNITGFSPQGGVWSGTGIIDGNAGTFDPQLVGVGSNTVTYTYVNTATGCSNQEDLEITVAPLPQVFTPDTVIYCNTSNDITLDGYGPLGGTWSGSGIINGTNTFNTILAGGEGQYQLVYEYSDNNSCSNTDTMIVDVIYGDTVTAGPDIFVCVDNGLVTFSGFSPAGGIWSGPGIIDPFQGTFDPASTGVGSHSVYYTYGEGSCEKTDEKVVSVGSIPTVNAGPDELVCEGDPTFLLTGQSPSGGYWLGAGVDSTGNFTPSMVGVGTHTVSYTYIDPVTSCENTDTKTITIAALPIVFAGDTTTYCNSPNTITLDGYAPNGGTWAGPGIISASGEFNTVQAGGEGMYDLVYTIVDDNGCVADDTLVVDVIYGDTVLAGPNFALCVTDGALILTDYSPAGGYWSGPGITDPVAGVFDPGVAGNGNHVLTYTFGEESCEKTDTRTVTVGSVPLVVTGNDQIVCEDETAFNLTGFSPAGGAWTGTGVDSFGVFDPQIAGIGIHILTYEYTHPVTGCQNSEDQTITVRGLPVVDAGGSVVYCNSGQNITLENYTPQGGIWSGPGIVNGTFGIFNTQSAGGEGQYQLAYSYTDSIGCFNSDTLLVDVIYGDTVVAGEPLTVCVYDNPFILQGTPAGGTWSGNGVVDASGIFSPDDAGVGTHPVTYTYGDGTCQKTDQQMITVGAIPVVEAGTNDIYCEGEEPFLITGQSPSGGYWLGTAVDSLGNFNPDVAGTGVHSLTYTYVSPATGCENTDTKQIIITPLPDVLVDDAVTYCNSPNTITLEGYSPQGGTWSGPGVINGTNTFNTVLAGGEGVYNLVYSVSGDNGCINTDTMIVDVIYGDTVVAGPNLALCITDGALVLSDYSPAGGVWSGTGIIDPVAGVFDPSAAGNGNHTLTYTYGEGTCEKTDTRTITVGLVPPVFTGPNLIVCEDETVFNLTGFSPAGGIWTGMGVTDSTGVFDPQVFGVGIHVLTYEYTHPVTGCQGSDNQVITVEALPVVEAGPPVVYCNSGEDITLENYSPEGGEWSGPGIVNSTFGIFNTADAGGEGQYQLTYSYTSPNGCFNFDTLLVDVIYGDTVVAGEPMTVCVYDVDINLQGSPAGGTWSGTGIVDSLGVFSPGTAGVGTFTVTYTYGDDTCEKTDQQVITVGSIPLVDAGPDEDYCVGITPFLITGQNPSGGYWLGTAVDSLGNFNPATAGIGEHTLTYTYVNPATGCENTDSKNITIAPLPNVFVGDTVTYCNSPNTITLDGYTPLGGEWSGPGVINGTNTFNTVLAGGEGIYNLAYAVTDSNSCVATDTLIVEVIYGDTVVAGPNFALCITDGAVVLSGHSPAGGTWSGPGIIDASGTFDPSVAGNGNHTLTYTYGEGTCEKTDTRTVTVGLVPPVFTGPDMTVCEVDSFFSLAGFSPAGGVWAGVGITDPAGVFDPQVSGIGEHTLVYQYTHPVTGCQGSDTQVITVEALPVVDAGGSVVYCNNPQNIVLENYTPAGGEWSGPGIVNSTFGIFNTEDAGGEGQYQLVYGYTSDNGCFNSDTLLVDVIYGDTVVAGDPITVCVYDTPISLSGSPAGGTWSGSGIIDPAGTFDPDAAGVGTHPVTYTFGVGTCQKTDQQIITVGAIPVVNAGTDADYCIDEPAFLISGQSPTGGFWLGVGVDSIGNFDPAVAGIGTHSLLYTYVNPATGCENIDEKEITINALPIVFAGDTATYCNTPNTIILDGYVPTGGVWSGTGVVSPSGEFNTIQAGGEGSYELIYAVTDDNGCVGVDTLGVAVIYGDTVVAGPDFGMCITDGIQILSDYSPTGGFWSGPGIIDAVTGAFDPNVAGNGNHTLTYTFGEESCEKTDTRVVTVGLVPPIFVGPEEIVCADTPPFSLSGFSPVGGTWSGVGITDATGVFDPQVAGIGVHTLTYDYTQSETGCQNSETKTITVEGAPLVDAGGTVVYCNNGEDIALDNYSPTGGFWDGPGIVNGVFGVFNTAAAGGEGQYELVYSYTNPNGCFNSDTLLVNVIYGDTVVAGPTVNLCILDGPTTIQGSPLGGTWSGVGIVDPSGTFSPGLAGVGSHTVTYTYGEGTCLKTDTRIVTVGDLPLVEAGDDEAFCIDASPVLFSGFGPEGGIWTGTGVDPSGVFDPAAAGVGLYELTYTYVDPVSGCESEDSKIVNVNPLPLVNAGDTMIFCVWDEIIVIDGYSPQGGTWTGPGIADPVDGTFSTVQAGGIGIYDLTYSFTDENGCTNTDVLTVVVEAGQVLDSGPDESVCVDNGLFQMASFSPFGGSWSGSGIVDEFNGVFNPEVAGVGIHQLTYTYGSGTCERSITKNIEVFPLPFVNVGEDATVCENIDSYPLNPLPVGGTWTGLGVDSVGNFDPQATGLGTFELIYTYTHPQTGCTNLDTVNLTVVPLPEASFTHPAEVCANDEVTFLNTSIGATTYLWQFGDGINSSQDTAFHTYTNEGVYDVTLVAFSPEGCADTTTSTITVLAEPNAEFTFSPSDGCAPLEVTFSDASTGYNLDYYWEFGNGQTSSLANPAPITYFQADVDTFYVITLTVSNQCGSSSKQDTVLVSPVPVVDFGSDVSNGCTPLTVNFTNNTVGLADNYYWDFGNGQTSSDSIPPPQVFTAGLVAETYTITLIASNECGADTSTTVVEVAPVTINSFFNVDVTEGCQPLEVQFTNLSTPGATLVWDFGDGAVSVLDAPSHTYDTSGVFTVTLYASNNCGVDSSSVDITVYPIAEVDFAMDNYSCVGTTVAFTNQSLDIVASEWDFGDGTTSQLANPSHTYNTSGTYTVTLTGYSISANCPATISKDIIIRDNPEVGMSLDMSDGCSPLTIQFQNDSPIASYSQWDFGDGSSAVVENPSHTYTTPGTYVATLTNTDNWGCASDTSIYNIIVYASPDAAFEASVEQLCNEYDEVTFTNQSTDATAYEWDFDNGVTSQFPSPTITYNTPGVYDVTLTASNPFGCTDEEVVPFEVLDSPIADLSIQVDNGCEDLFVQFYQEASYADSYEWDFGDGSMPSEEENPTHLYTEPGTYDVSLYISYDEVCFDTIVLPEAVEVYESAIAGFDVIQNGGGWVEFVNTSQNATSYDWDLGDGTLSTGVNVVHRYEDNGTKVVRLIANNTIGCPDTMLLDFSVEPFYGLQVPNAFSPETGVDMVRQFYPIAFGLKNYHIQVFTPWGELMWESKAINEKGVPTEFWDGYHDGVIAPQGAYVWKVIRAEFIDGTEWPGMDYGDGKKRRIGSVTLLR